MLSLRRAYLRLGVLLGGRVDSRRVAAGIITTLIVCVAPQCVQARTYSWYTATARGGVWPRGSDEVGRNYLARHMSSHGGTAAAPWDLSAGDYCNAYGFNSLAKPFTVRKRVNYSDLTGYSPPTNVGYQLGNAVTSNPPSVCQASGPDWGAWANSNDPGSSCSDWCGISHSVSFDGAPYFPWSRRFGTAPKLELSGNYYPYTYSYASGDNTGWAYLCALLVDTTTHQRLEYCLDEWNTWGAAPDEVGGLFFDTALSPAREFANVVTNFDAGTRFATRYGRSDNTAVGTGSIRSDQSFDAIISRSNFASAVDAVNSLLEASNGGVCPTGAISCYARAASGYKLLGLEHGQEFRTDPSNRDAGFGGLGRSLAARTRY